MNCQLHVPVALHPVFFRQKAGWVLEAVPDSAEEENLLSLPGIEAMFYLVIQPVA
jgi:hypothetical protein